MPADADGVGSDIVIRGNYVGTDALGLVAIPNTQGGINISAPRATVAGNVISGNNQTGLNFGTNHNSTTGQVYATGSDGVVTGNRIGLKATVDEALPNSGGGIGVSVPGVTIGGTALTERNLISGNGGPGISAFASLYDPDGPGPSPNIPFTPPVIPSGLVVANNYIGTNAAGTVAIRNFNGAILSAPNAVVRNNLISGNTGNGLSLSNHFNGTTGELYSGASGAIVEGNTIGTNAAGNAALPNFNGISVVAPSSTIGGSLPTQRNLISGNNGSGISILPSVTSTNIVVASGQFTVIKGNYIGVNAAGTARLTNFDSGIFSTVGDVTIGGPTQEDGNVIAGEREAITLTRIFFDSGGAVLPAGNNTIRNNTIGLNANRDARLNTRNSWAISIATSANQVVQNVIAGNGDTGGFNPNGNAISLGGNDNSVRGNLIGTNPSGALGLGNFGTGISIVGSNNTIGGVLEADRNVIVGHGLYAMVLHGAVLGSTNNVVQGNYIGILPDGVTPHNNNGGISVEANSITTISGTLIGGEAPGAHNVIAGNFKDGITLQGGGVSNTTIAGNFIGLAADGVTARSNTVNGIQVIRIRRQHDRRHPYRTRQSHRQQWRRRRHDRRWRDRQSDPVQHDDRQRRSRYRFDRQRATTTRQPPLLSNASNTPGPNTTVTASMPGAGTFTLQFFANTVCDPSGGEGDRLVGSLHRRHWIGAIHAHRSGAERAIHLGDRNGCGRQHV